MHRGHGEEVGSALRRMVQELIAERRRITLLERENRRLKVQVALAEEHRARPLYPPSDQDGPSDESL